MFLIKGAAINYSACSALHWGNDVKKST